MRPADGPRQHPHVIEIEMPAGKAEALASPRAPHDFDGLQRAAEALLARQLEARKLLRAIGRADSQAQAPVGDHVDHRRIFGQAQRMIEGRQQHIGADRDAPRAGGDGGQCRHDRRQIAVVGKVMFGQPYRIEARSLDEFDLAEHLRVKFRKL
jgi:hypothetical protein